MTDASDEDFGRTLIGKYILAGVTYIDAAGRPIEQKQIHGKVVRANRDEGIVLRLEPSGDEFKLPPVIGAFEPAEPGEYRLRSTGEVVTDPDYLCTWSVKRPTAH
jgi:hypothetical protein